ncbi:unnamed protein product, partial [Effrenium voratum]
MGCAGKPRCDGSPQRKGSSACELSRPSVPVDGEKLGRRLWTSWPACRRMAIVLTPSALLGACAKAGRWQAAEVPKDTVAYTSAVSAFALRSSWQRAAQLLEMAQDCGLRCDVVLRSAAASACEKGGAWRSAVQLADSGQDTQLLNIALLAATRRGSRATWASALAHVAAMTLRSLRRDGFTFSPLQ